MVKLIKPFRRNLSFVLRNGSSRKTKYESISNHAGNIQQVECYQFPNTSLHLMTRRRPLRSLGLCCKILDNASWNCWSWSLKLSSGLLGTQYRIRRVTSSISEACFTPRRWYCDSIFSRVSHSGLKILTGYPLMVFVTRVAVSRLY